MNNKPLRILQIVPSISLIYGGPSQMVLGFSKALAEEGAHVTILTTDANGDSGQAPLDVPLAHPVRQEGYTIRYFRCAPWRRYKFSIGLLLWLIRHARHFDVAHIHALFSPVSSLAAAIARCQSLPYLLRPLGTLDPADLKKKRQLKQLYVSLLERPNLARAAAIHFTSDQEALISERFGVKTTDLVLPLGVAAGSIEPPNFSILKDLGIPKAVLNSATPMLLYMSRIDPKKGLDLLVPALERLFADGIAFHFVLAGSNPQDPGYEQQIGDRLKSSTIAHHVTITGFVQGDAKTALLHGADVFVLPSYYENFGIAVAEAMAAGVPVVISDQVHIHPDIQTGNAGWVCSCDVDDLTEQLRAACTQPEERLQRGKQAQLWAREHYSWHAIARRAIAIYREIQQNPSQFQSMK